LRNSTGTKQGLLIVVSNFAVIDPQAPIGNLRRRAAPGKLWPEAFNSVGSADKEWTGQVSAASKFQRMPELVFIQVKPVGDVYQPWLHARCGSQQHKEAK
jgi:hypothetical protein